ncbi:MAG: ABC transporter permease [Armatimonadota bacterium]|nr:ABC transporter permease [Armatimonadota bacterium]MDR7592861.1 ABC transporter permease [Armatimonadota bacterium]
MAAPPRSRLASALRAVRMGAWLGWQVQANWTDPLLFFIYSIARPLGGALILVFMFAVVAGGRRGPLLDFFLVGAALWPYVVWTMQGLGWAVLEEREHFKMIRYVYTAPIPFWAFLVGRGLSMTLTGLAPMLITLLLGVVALDLPLVFSPERAAYALAAFLLGLAGLVAMGLLLVGVVFLISGEAWRLPEAVGAALYLLSGAIFPVTVLPGWLQGPARVVPVTWWLEAMRRALLPAGHPRSFPALDDGAVLALLGLTVALAALMGGLVYQAGLWSARRRGILDAETHY